MIDRRTLPRPKFLTDVEIDLILNAWQQGHSAGKIIRLLADQGISRTLGGINSVIFTARKNGDARAIYRGPASQVVRKVRAL